MNTLLFELYHTTTLQNLVDKVKSWLAPSSWLSYLTPSKDGQSSGSRNGPLIPPQDSPPTSTADQRQQHPSHAAASQYEGPSNEPVHPDQSNVLTSTASDLLRSGTRSTTANYRAALSLFEEALGNNHSSNSQPTDPQLTNNPADSSNESFVEEEIEPEGTTDSPRGISDMDVQTGGQSTEQIFASDESQSTSIVRAHSPAQVEGTDLQEHTVQLVSNPAFPNKANPSHRRTVMISPKVTKGLSAELTRRLYSPAAPRLSPVHERREVNVSRYRITPVQCVLLYNVCLHRAILLPQLIVIAKKRTCNYRKSNIGLHIVCTG